MEKMDWHCWERIICGAALPLPGHLGHSGTSSPCVTDWKCLSLSKCQKCSFAKTFLPWEGMSLLPLIHFKLLQRDAQSLSVVKRNQPPEVPLWAVRGALQKAIQNCFSSEFLFTRASCPTDCNACLERLTPPGWSYYSLQPAFLAVPITFFLTAKLVSVGFWFSVFRIPNPREAIWSSSSSETTRSRNIFTSVLKSKMP